MPGDNGEAHLSIFKAAVEAGAGGMMTSYSIITDGKGEPYYGNLMGSAYDKVWTRPVKIWATTVSSSPTGELPPRLKTAPRVPCSAWPGMRGI